MAQTQLSSKLGSNNSIFDVKENAKIQFSKFDFSKKNFTTLDIGSIVPVDWFDVYPGDVVKLNLRYLLESFPLIVPPMNNYRVRTHWYYVKKSSLWSGWQTFITKGRNGSINWTIPTKHFGDDNCSYPPSLFGLGEDDGTIVPFVANSLSSYLGLKPLFNGVSGIIWLPWTASALGGEKLYNISDGIASALPFFAYQKIYRHAYLNPNLLQDNHVWFPENLDSHWRINADKSNFDGESFIPEGNISSVSSKVGCFIPSVSDTVVNTCCLRYAPYEMDYFTSAKPWLVRGKETSLEMPVDISGLNTSISGDELIDVDLSVANGFDDSSSRSGNYVQEISNNGDNNVTFRLTTNPGVSVSHSVFLSGVLHNLASRLSVGLSGSASSSLKLTANTLRSLLALSVWQERNALTNGNYNEFIDAHFNKNPKSDDYEPYYLGGTSDLVQFGRVIQTSASVPGGNPLGSEAGQASSNGGAEVFDFKVNDYGIIMGVMIISPEVIYNDGIGHEWTDLTSDSIFTPEFANLGYQPVLNKEIKFTNNPELDDSLFGYQTRYAYLKQRKNSVSGLFALDSAQDRLFNAYVQKRHFSSTPSLSLQFVTMSPDNLDRSFLAYPSQPAFKLQFASDVELIRALPYQSEPNTFGF